MKERLENFKPHLFWMILFVFWVLVDQNSPDSPNSMFYFGGSFCVMLQTWYQIIRKQYQEAQEQRIQTDKHIQRYLDENYDK